MNFKRIIPLFLAFLIVIQPSVSYPGKHHDYSELTTIGVKLLYIIVTMAIGGYIVAWIQKRNFRPDTSFSSVNNIKEKLADYKGKIPQAVLNLIDQLKNPLKYKNMNVSLTKGILFYGDSGCGKTHLARCIAGEIKCPFIETNATKFSQPLFGNARAAIENLFASAKFLAQKHESETVIIFIDEFDSIGSRKDKNRYFNFSNPEIITTLLGQMDGFNRRDVNIVIIGATNYLDKIDSAIIRSGRFDTKVRFSTPKYSTRKELIEYFFKKNIHDNTISSDGLTQVTDGMTQADIKELFNAAGRIAINDTKKTRDKASFVYAIFKIKESERDQQIASREERLELIDRMINANRIMLPFDLSAESLTNCTKSMTLLEVNEIFTLADNKRKLSNKELKQKISLDMIAEASLLVEDQIKRTNILEKIDIAQKIYQIDEETIKSKWNNQELLSLTSSEIIKTCEDIVKPQIS